MNSPARKLIPLYTSKGDVEAFLVYPYIYNRTGDWIGFVTPKREVYSVIGNYVGMLSDDFRIIGRRATNTLKPRLQPPPAPGKVYPPATVPLAPMMRELTHSQIDILLDEPERLHTIDSGEFREDMD
ncbi:MAG: hypothetical protein JW963_13435 [Anaerolineales bacterium]|nr:hypothetical protein [Anaerolineales bacterium]